MDLNDTVLRARGLTNKHLTAILKAEGLPSSGNKSQLVGRVVNRLQEVATQARVDDFNKLRDRILGTENVEPPRTMFHPFSVPSGPPRPKSNPHLRFRDTAFYSILDPATTVYECPTMVNHRHTITAPFNIVEKYSQRLYNDKSLRVMLFCTSDSLEGFSAAEISFPVQVELKVNGQVVKANFRGLKNKPGTTRPVDITDQLNKSSHFRNTVALTYALTQKLMYVKYSTVDELVEKIKNGRILSVQTVKKQIISKSSDPDIVATSTVLSLKCPLSTLRMDVPCRSNLCSHVQCFDANSFLQTQEQAPTWTCPICNKIISFEALVVDDYVRDILKHTSRDVDQVVIDPSGEWSNNSKSPVPAQKSASDDDDDIVEIIDSGKPSGIYTATPSRNTPASNSIRGVASSTASTPSNKRPIAQVIDLTLSDSEDDNPVPPPKRQSIAPTRPLPFHMTPATNGSASSSSSNQPQVFPARIDQQENLYDNQVFSPFRTPDPFSPNSFYRNDRMY